MNNLEQREPQTKEKKTKNVSIKEVFLFFKDFILIFWIFYLFIQFIIWPSQISWNSMDSNFYNKEYILVNKFSYLNLPYVGKIQEYKRWDVVVFDPEITKEKRYLIKRIIGLPGEEVIIKFWEVFILWKDSRASYSLKEEYLNEENFWGTYVNWSNEEFRYKVPENSYFLMWDNRKESTDARECFHSCKINNNNFIKKSQIVWKVFIDLGYFSLKEFSFLEFDSKTDSKPRFFNFPKDFSYE